MSPFYRRSVHRNVVPEIECAFNVLGYLRDGEEYTGSHFEVMMGPQDRFFVDLARHHLGKVAEFSYPFDDVTGRFIELDHLAAVSDGILLNVFYLGEYAGWGGDLLTALADALNAVSDPSSPEQVEGALYNIIGQSSQFGYDDLVADVDGQLLAMKIIEEGENSLRFTDAIVDYYSSFEPYRRYSQFYEKRFNFEPEELYSVAREILFPDINNKIRHTAWSAFKIAFSIPY